jgi:predicted nucleotidyltransferase
METTHAGQLANRIARALESRDEVLEAYLFGSHALGRARAHSDIDIAVYVDERRLTADAYGYCDYVPQLAKIDAARRAPGGATPGTMTRRQADPEVIRRHLAERGLNGRQCTPFARCGPMAP